MLRLVRFANVQVLKSHCASTSALPRPFEDLSLTDEYIERERKLSVQNCKPVPVVIAKAKNLVSALKAAARKAALTLCELGCNRLKLSTGRGNLPALCTLCLLSHVKKYKIETSQVCASARKPKYHPQLSRTRAKAQVLDVHAWDVEGRVYYDFLSGYSSLNQGHCHPRLVRAMQKQAETLTLVSRAFHNNTLGEFGAYMSDTFGYDKVLPMSTGAECCEMAIKLAQQWAYDIKNVVKNQARVVLTKGNFWEQSIAAMSVSESIENQNKQGPCTPRFDLVPFNDIKALENVLSDVHVAAFIVEPIQSEAGVVVPDKGYLQKVRELCTKYNVLMIADEVQIGLGRTGKMLCCDHENVRPDVVMLGRALSGGMYPVSAILANDPVMLTVKASQHNSPYSGNPMACRMAIEALQIIKDEKLCESAEEVGKVLRRELKRLPRKTVVQVRGKGLLYGLVVNPRVDAWQACLKLKENGILAAVSNSDVILLSPPLTIKENQVREAAQLIIETMYSFKDW